MDFFSASVQSMACWLMKSRYSALVTFLLVFNLALMSNSERLSVNSSSVFKNSLPFALSAKMKFTLEESTHSTPKAKPRAVNANNKTAIFFFIISSNEKSILSYST